MFFSVTPLLLIRSYLLTILIVSILESAAPSCGLFVSIAMSIGFVVQYC